MTKTYRIYGADGHRQKESFDSSYTLDCTVGEKVRVLDVRNSDKTGTNAYTEIAVTRGTEEECDAEIRGQITDGIFENYRTGKVTVVSPDGTEKEAALWG